MREGRAWRPLGRLGGHLPRVPDTGTIELSGLPPNTPVRVGFTLARTDGSGGLALRPATDEHLSGHVGVVQVSIDGEPLGELEIVPDKMSEPAYRVLRAELQRTWTDLIYDDASVTAVQASLPAARELWRRIAGPVTAILEHPHEQLGTGVAPRRLERVRRRAELKPGVVRAGMQGRSARVTTIVRTSATAENHLVADTMRLLRDHARRDSTADDVVARIDDHLRSAVLAQPHRPVRRITWGMRADPRYRQVLAVHQLLNRPELGATEGPGELRLGVPALSRLYEYWVYLQVLRAARDRYGPPLGPGFEVLAVRSSGLRRRLELPAGTTVAFPGGIHVVFEPMITSRGDGWMGLEYVPHPDPTRTKQLRACPDVLVLRAGERPSALVVDAKYVGRAFVELDAVHMHEKYARIRLGGRPVVRSVQVAHPHLGLDAQWAGYGHFPAVPGERFGPVPLPLPSEQAGRPEVHDEASGPPVAPGVTR